MSCPVITILPLNLPQVVLNVTYNQTISATGGVSPYQYTISAGSLPTGFILNMGLGTITGTITNNITGLFTFTVEATDVNGCIGTENLTISVNATVVTNVTILDQYTRLQMLMCIIESKGNKLASKLRLGMVCQDEITCLEVLVMYFESLKCYDPTNPQCLTQDQINLMWDCISQMTGLCFAPYGQTGPLPSSTMMLLQENSGRLMSESGIPIDYQVSLTPISTNDTLPYYI